MFSSSCCRITRFWCYHIVSCWMYSCVGIYSSFPPICAGSVFAFWCNPCTYCLSLGDPLLNWMFQLLSVSQGAALGPLCTVSVCVSGRHWGLQGWVGLGWSGMYRLQDPMGGLEGCWTSLPEGSIPTGWLATGAEEGGWRAWGFALEPRA